MAKQLNVQMIFEADTTKAKAQLEQLKTTLNNLATGKSLNFKETPINKSLQESINAASQLKTMLESATNASTGKLDLTAFTRSLKNSGLEVKDIRAKLEALGPEGTSAFIQMSRAIQQADTPLISISKRMNSLLTTIKNTAKWQISSSILHGFMGAVQGAYRYAQDLNESLNNIRIRTGQSTEEMAKFAQQANETAKALSTTTTSYTNAALIYYQQGLNDEQVKARTDITVKMANVTRDSAETVSQQLTAVWNNFDKTGEKLEYIADVMNALGAATASSTSEIATGLQKFSAVAKTAGMSYEYAASALATITAVTRQSADTVGTGLRTVLARIESLNLGETLEDGVGLTKYTKALESIGVQVLDTNGQLRKADQILDDMASKWKDLTDAQKMATAETVGGIRQYSTIMALMENWDFMQQNVKVAESSEGTLQKQADIYAESWEAAQKRVKAAAQEIYTDLIDDKFFITILNGTEKILTFIDDIIKSLGGLPGLLSTIATIVFKLFSPQITSGLTTAAQTLGMLTPSGRRQMEDYQKQFIQEGSNVAVRSSGYESEALVSTLDLENEVQKAINENAHKFSEEQQRQISQRQQLLQQGNDLAQQEAKQLDTLEKELAVIEDEVLGKAKVEDEILVSDAFKNARRGALEQSQLSDQRTSAINNLLTVDDTTTLETVTQRIEKLSTQFNLTSVQAKKFFKDISGSDVTTDKIVEVAEGITSISPAAQRAVAELGVMWKNIKTNGHTTTTLLKNSKLELNENVQAIQRASDMYKNSNLKQFASDISSMVKGASGKTKEYLILLAEVIERQAQFGDQLTFNEKSAYDLINALNKTPPFQNWATSFVSVAQGISTLSMGINSLVGSFSTLVNGIKDGTLTASQLLSVIGSLGMSFTMVIPSAIKMFNSLTTTLAQTAVVQNLVHIGSKKLTSSIIEENVAQALNKVLTKEVSDEKKAWVITTILQTINDKKLSNELKQEAIAEALVTIGVKETTAAKWAELIVTKLLEIATKKYLLIAMAAIAVIAALALVISKLVVTQKEAAESIKKSTEAYDEEKKKLDELKSSLQEVQDKIDELNSKDSLTITEQEELRKLKLQEDSLKRQVELQERLTELKRQAQIADIKKNYSKSTQTDESQMGNKAAYQQFYGNTAEKEWEEVKDNPNDPRYAERQQAYQDHLNMLAQYDARYLEANSEVFEEAETNFLTYLLAIEDGVAKVDSDFEGIVNDYANARKKQLGDSYNASVLEDAFNLTEFKDFDISQIFQDGITAEKLIPSGSDLETALLKAGIPVQNFFDALSNKSNEFIGKFKEDAQGGVQDWLKGLSGEDLALALTLNIDGSETVEELKEKFAQLKEEVAETQAQLDKESIKANYTDNKKTAEAVKNGATEISADEYAKLGSLAKDFFVEAYDGTYKLVGAADEFYASVEKGSKQVLQEEVTDKQQRLAQISPEQSQTQIQLNELENIGAVDQEQLDRWQQMLQTGSQVRTAMAEIRIAAQEAGIDVNQLSEEFNVLSEALAQDQMQLAVSCLSLRELYDVAEQGKLTLADGTFNIEAYNQGLIALGSQHENCSTEVERFKAALEAEKEALEEGNEAEIERAELQKESAHDNLILSTRAGELAEQYDLTAEEIEEYAKQLKNSEKYQDIVGSELAEMAKDQLRYDKAVQSTTKNLSKWQTALKAAAQTGFLATDSAEEMRQAYGDLLDLDPEQFSAGFLQDEHNLQLLQNAINGVDGAYEELQQAAQDDLNMQLHLDGDEEFLGKVNQIENAIAGLPDGIDLGDVTIDNQGALDALTDLVNAAGMTAEEATNYLSSMGIDAEVETVPAATEPVPTMEDYWEPATYDTEPISTGGEKEGSGLYKALKKVSDGHWVSAPSSHTEETSPSAFSLKVTSAHKSSGGGLKFRQSAPAHGSGGSKGGGGGGGGSTKTNYAKHQKSEPKQVERYKEINDELSDLTRALNKANDASDRLWGQDRLKSMEEERDLIRQQADALQRKKKEAEDYYEKDKKALNDYLKSSWTGYRENENGPETAITSSLAALGLGNLAFEYDADGSITNWEDVYGAIYKKYNDMQAYWANPENWKGPNGGDAQEQYEKETLKPFEEWIKGLEEYDKQYQDTTELIKDLNEELADNLNTWQDLNFEELTYKLELKLQINENDLKRIEYYMDKLDGDFYQMGENLANYSAKIQNTEDALEIYKGHLVDITTAYTTLDEQYKAGEISEKDYYEQLQKIHDESYDYLSTLTELNKTMQEYFENTLDAAVEELEKYTDRLDHVNDSLEHYQEIMKLMGKQSDYKMIGAFLQGIANNNMNRYLVSKTFYEELVGKRGVLESQLASADLTEEGRKTIQKELLALNEQIEEAEDKMLDNAQATAETMQEIWQNTVDEISHDFEMLATDGLGFDFLNDSLDRLQSRQDEYLTKTNQLYEMNDLLRKLQSDSDKTNNVAAKQRIANFSNEMKQLRNKNELSKLDLDIAKARYQQLLAEIALEEAQNAKSMVRLHRDNEGNYGYMYTADQDKVGAAEDALAKANNDLYNIVLEGTNKYGQMSIDLAEEYIEKRAALEQWAQENHLEESEEYQRKLYELQQEYERLRLASAREYNTAYTWLANPEVSTLGTEEAWTTEQRDAILASQNPYIYIETSKKLADSTKDFFENIQPLLEGVNSLASAIGTPEELIGNLTDYSNELTEALIGEGGLVDAIGSELQEVLDGTNKYLHEQQKELLETQRSWEALDNEIAKAIVLQSGITGESIADETLQRIIASANFDTGGYTGRWGNSGKLAILHEKELILNQEDTENLLLSIDILRRLTNALDLQAMSSGLASISSATSINAGGSTLQQDVTIHAEFPNAVDHNEIEMAFDTLINRASQYMGRF